MAERYFVSRLWIKHKGKVYQEGEFLPADFTYRDKYRNIWPSRIGVKEVEELTVVVPPAEIPLPSLTPVPVEEKKTVDIDLSTNVDLSIDTKPISEVDLSITVDIPLDMLPMIEEDQDLENLVIDPPLEGIELKVPEEVEEFTKEPIPPLPNINLSPPVPKAPKESKVTNPPKITGTVKAVPLPKPKS